MLGLQQALADRVRELEEAITQVKQLRGLLPICSYCKSIRRDGDYWEKVEHYIAANSDAQFSHGICPSCYTPSSSRSLPRYGKRKAPATRLKATHRHLPKDVRAIPSLRRNESRCRRTRT